MLDVLTVIYDTAGICNRRTQKDALVYSPVIGVAICTAQKTS